MCVAYIIFIYMYRVVQKKLWVDLEEKCLRNSEMFFLWSLSLYVYIHILSRCYSFLSYVEKKLWGSKNPEKRYFFVLFCFFIKAKWLIKNLFFLVQNHLLNLCYSAVNLQRLLYSQKFVKSKDILLLPFFITIYSIILINTEDRL